MNKQRLSKFLAHQGIASRRAIEKMIAAGRIAVNGQIVTHQGIKIDQNTDKVTVDGKLIQVKDELVYYWLNKPVGVISATFSPQGETTVTDLIPTHKRIYPVGRLDKDSQGLILLTNDGTLTHRLTHPKFHIDKTYIVKVVGNITKSKLNKLRSGINLEEGMTLPAIINQVDEDTLEFIIHEGKHRQIRRMCAAVHLHVTELIRTKFGTIGLDKLPLGEYRPATSREITTLKQLVGLGD